MKDVALILISVGLSVVIVLWILTVNGILVPRQ